LNLADLGLDSLHFLHGAELADFKGEESHVDDEGEDHDGPAPVGNEAVRVLKDLHQGLGDDAEPAEIDESVELWAEMGENAKILGADKEAHVERRGSRLTDGDLGFRLFGGAVVVANFVLLNPMPEA